MQTKEKLMFTRVLILVTLAGAAASSVSAEEVGDCSTWDAYYATSQPTTKTYVSNQSSVPLLTKIIRSESVKKEKRLESGESVAHTARYSSNQGDPGWREFRIVAHPVPNISQEILCLYETRFRERKRWRFVNNVTEVCPETAGFSISCRLKSRDGGWVTEITVRD